jgi:hypothetical protein
MNLKSRNGNRRNLTGGLIKYYLGDKINISGACSMHKNTRDAHKTLTGNRREETTQKI